MERLPYIDEHDTEIAVAPEAAWTALLSVLSTQADRIPPVLIGPWGLQPARRRGAWAGAVAAGDALPGFEVASVETARRLVLRGRHRFSHYELVFVLERTVGGGCRLRAQTRAEFSGRTGAGYRALVIGTGGHRVAVRRLLRGVDRRARAAPASVGKA